MQEEAKHLDQEAITRCPHCSTSFRVSAAHINTAKGAVRCGSCLGIFNALQHVLLEPSRELTPTSAQKDTQNDLPEDTPPTTQSTLQKTNDRAKLTGATSTPADPPREAIRKKEDHLADDQADVMLNDGDDDENDEDVFFNIDDLEKDIKRQQTKPMPESSLFEFSFERDEEPDIAEQDEEWALDLLDNVDADKQTDPQDNKGDDTGIHAHIDLFQSRDIEHVTGEQEALDFSGIDKRANTDYEREEEAYYRQFEADNEDGDEEFDDSAYDQGAFGAHSSTRYVESIRPEPVEFTWKPGPRFWQSNIFWGALAAAMALVLALQLAVINFDKLSRIEPYRQYYGAVCHWFVCEIPALENRSAVVATNLIIRAHPNLPDILVVDALLQNKADYSQPFPPLDLVFTDISGRPIIAKRIKAEEYLGGELTGAKTMPPRQPVRISLTLRDPGEKAKGYKLDIAP